MDHLPLPSPAPTLEVVPISSLTTVLARLSSYRSRMLSKPFMATRRIELSPPPPGLSLDSKGVPISSLTAHGEQQNITMNRLTLTPPPPGFSLNCVSISSLTDVLARLGFEIPIEDVIKAVHDEKELANRVRLTTTEATKRRIALCKLLTFEPPINKASLGPKITTVPVGKFIPNPKPNNVDPLAKERRRRLIELTKEAFPKGFEGAFQEYNLRRMRTYIGC